MSLASLLTARFMLATEHKYHDSRHMVVQNWNIYEWSHLHARARRYLCTRHCVVTWKFMLRGVNEESDYGSEVWVWDTSCSN
jgi:hypothetical protein